MWTDTCFRGHSGRRSCPSRLHGPQPAPAGCTRPTPAPGTEPRPRTEGRPHQERLLLLRTALLLVTQVVVVHQVAEGLGGDGHHVGKDDPAVTAAREDQLVVGVVVADAPHPAGTGRPGPSRSSVPGRPPAGAGSWHGSDTLEIPTNGDQMVAQTPG